jgi:hypothetical protein
MEERHYRRLFKDEEILKEMLVLYEEGWSMPALAKKYNCHHTSILHQLSKHGIPSRTRVRIPFFKTEKRNVIYYPPKVAGKYDTLLAEKTNPGKSYAQYRKEAAARKRVFHKDHE